MSEIHSNINTILNRSISLRKNTKKRTSFFSRKTKKDPMEIDTDSKKTNTKQKSIIESRKKINKKIRDNICVKKNIKLLEENIAHIFNDNIDLMNTINISNQLHIPYDTIYENIYISMKDSIDMYIISHRNIRNIPHITSRNYNDEKKKLLHYNKQANYLEHILENINSIYDNTIKDVAEINVYNKILSIKHQKLSYLNNIIVIIDRLLNIEIITSKHRNDLNELKVKTNNKIRQLNNLNNTKIKQMIISQDNFRITLNKMAKLLMKSFDLYLYYFYLPISRLADDNISEIITITSELLEKIKVIFDLQYNIYIKKELLNKSSSSLKQLDILTLQKKLKEELINIKKIKKIVYYDIKLIKYYSIKTINSFFDEDGEFTFETIISKGINDLREYNIKTYNYIQSELQNQIRITVINNQRKGISRTLNPFKTLTILNKRSDCEIIESRQLSKCINNINITSSFFNDFKRELIKKCNIYNRKKDLNKYDDKKAIIDKFKNYFVIPNYINHNMPIIKHYQGHSIISLFIRYIENTIKTNSNNLNSIFFNDDDNYYVINYYLIYNNHNHIIGEDRTNGIDGGGLRRNLFAGLLSELFTDKIFIKREGSNKYFINPKFEPNKEFTHIYYEHFKKTFDFKDENNIKLFYKFIGNLLSLIFVSNYGFEHKFSSSIMAHFIYNTEMLDDYDYVYFLYEDFPELFNSYINLINSVSTEYDPIKDSCLDFNDYYYLKKNNNYYNYFIKDNNDEEYEVNKDNFVEYIKLTAKCIMTENILRKNIEITYDDLFSLKILYNNISQFYNLAFKSLISGIPYDIREYVANKKLTLQNVTSFMTIGSITPEIIEKLKIKFNIIMNHLLNNTRIDNETLSIEPIEDESKPKTQELTNFFNEFVLTKKTNETQEEFNLFISKLLNFWSGVPFFVENYNYNIVYEKDWDINKLPQSHTCFYRIDLPGYITGEILREKIEIAVYGIEEGIGLYGGKKRNNKSKNVKKV